MLFLYRFLLASYNGFRHYFDFSGRTSKLDFWLFLLFFLIAYLLVWLVDHFFLTPVVVLRNLPFGYFLPGGYADGEVGLLVLAYRPIMAVPTLSATVRRLRDVGKSGWWSLLWIFPLPIVGWFWLIPWLTADSEQKNDESE